MAIKIKGGSMIWLVIGICCFVVISSILLNTIFPIPNPKTETIYRPFHQDRLRFQKVETFIFTRTEYGTTTAVIYEDTETGVKYLYFWEGINHGGPCITRLWDN